MGVDGKEEISQILGYLHIPDKIACMTQAYSSESVSSYGNVALNFAFLAA